MSDILQDLMVASPCPIPGRVMDPKLAVQNCAACSNRVHNLSAMSRREVEKMLGDAQPLECVRIYRRVDGTMITDECPRALRGIRDRLLKVASLLTGIFAALTMSSSVRAQAQANDPNLFHVEGTVIDERHYVQTRSTKADTRAQDEYSNGLNLDSKGLYHEAAESYTKALQILNTQTGADPAFRSKIVSQLSSAQEKARAKVSVAVVAKPFKGQDVFDQIFAKAKAEKWSSLPIGELMGKIALEFEGTRYKSDTLELYPDKEVCSANLEDLDCVTFFETTLDFARMLKHGGDNSSDLLKEISFTRYRNGKLGDFTSRLHYTGDWFTDNEAKQVVKRLSDLPGSQPFTQKVSVMSSNPNRQLIAHPELVAVIRQQEETLNKRQQTFVPLDKIAAIEPLLQTGDIVGICSSKPGIDMTHTGLILCTADGVRHFMDASSKPSKMKVTIEPGPISGALTWSKSITGIMVARPLEPK